MTASAAAKPVRLYDKLPGFLDGSVLAEICDGETVVGTAALVFPVYGTDSELTDATTIGRQAKPAASRQFHRMPVETYNFHSCVKKNTAEHPVDLIGLCLEGGQPNRKHRPLRSRRPVGHGAVRRRILRRFRARLYKNI